MNPIRIDIMANTHTLIATGVTVASVVIQEPGGGVFATYLDTPSLVPIDLTKHQRITSQQFDVRYPTPVDVWIWTDRAVPVLVYQ